MATTKEQLADRLVKAMKKDLEAFIGQQSPEAAEAKAAYEELEKQKAAAAKALGEDSAAYAGAVKAIEKEQSKLDTDDKKGEANNRKHAALALVIAAREFKLPVALRKSATSSGSGTGSRSRMSTKELADACEVVLKALPAKSVPDDKCKSIGELADATNLDANTVKSALSKMKRDGSAESNGKRGTGGGWRKA